MMEGDAGFQCGYCFEWNETAVDRFAGEFQSYVEDCQICCRPNLLRITVDPESGDATISAEFEG
ncbi:MAG: CPXCG motif-containing cysteine-rich protein [Myxococcota bacterium]